MTAWVSESKHYSFKHDLRVAEIRGPFTDNGFVVEFQEDVQHGDTVSVKLSLEECRELAQDLFVRTEQIVGIARLA
jgi:hypothetical protein